MSAAVKKNKTQQELIALNYIPRIKKSISNFVLYSASYQNKVEKNMPYKKIIIRQPNWCYIQYNKNTNTS